MNKMIFRMRKTIARILLPFLMIWMCVVPSRSYAFVLVPWALSAVSSTATVLLAEDLAMYAIASGLLANLLYFDVKAPDNSSVAVPLQDQAVNPAAIVPLPVLPSTASPNTVDGYCAANFCSSTGNIANQIPADAVGVPDTICHDLVIANPGWFYGSTVTRTTALTSSADIFQRGFVCEFNSAQFGGWGAARYYWNHFGCPAGYTGSGSTCVLTNSRLAQDNRQDWIRQGNVYSRYTGDLSGSAAGTLGTTNTANDSVSVIGKNSAGNVISYTIVALPGGGSQITKLTQMTDASGNTYVQRRVIGFDSSGTQVSGSGSSQSGSLNPAIPAADGGATVVPAPAGTIPGNPTSTAPLVFPSDYSRAGEAGAAAIPIGAKLDTLHADVNPATFGVPVGIDPAAAMRQQVDLVSALPALPSISWMPSIMPGAGTCHAMVFNMDIASSLLSGMHGNFNLDVCNKLDSIRQVLGYLFYMATSVYIFRAFVTGGSFYRASI